MPIFGAKSRAARGCASKLACGRRIGPAECTVFTVIFGEFVTSQRADVGIGPYNAFTDNISNFELCQIPRERSKKTEAVFLGALKGAPGGNRNPPGLVFFLSLFLLEKQKKK